MKQKFSIFLMSFMLVMQIISNGLFIPMTASATDTVVSDDATTEQLAKANEAAEAAEQAHLEKTQSFIADLFTSNEKIAIKQGIAEGQITTAKAYTEQLTELTDDETKASLQQDITLVEAFVAVNALFGDDNETIMKGLTQATIDAAQEKVNLVSEKSLSKGKAVLDEKLAAATKQLANNNKVKTKATKIANETTAAASEEKVEASVKQGTKAKAVGENPIEITTTNNPINLKFEGFYVDKTKQEIADYHPQIGDNTNINFTWNIAANSGYGNGTQFTFQLPKNFLMANDVEGDAGTYATYTVDTTGKVILTLQNLTSENQIIKDGTLNFSTEFQKVGDNNSLNQKIEFPFAGSTPIEITFTPKEHNEPANIQKEGTFINNKTPSSPNINPEGIKWEIIVNSNMASIKQASIEDVLPDGQELTQGTLVVKKAAEPGLDGKPINDELTKVEGISNFPIKLGDINTKYIIRYETTTTGEIKPNYKNEATLKGVYNEKDISLLDDKSMDTLSPKPIKKDGNLDSDGTSINWTIYANMDGTATNGSDATIEDTLSGDGAAYQKFDKATIKIWKYPAVDDQGNPTETDTQKKQAITLDESNINIKDKVLTITIPNADGSPYVITYKTKKTKAITETVFVKNTVTINGKELDEAKKVELKERIFFTKSDAYDANYDDNTVKWDLTVNQDGDTLKKGSIIEDTLGDRLDWENSSNLCDIFTTEPTLTCDTDYSVELIEDEKKAKIKFLTNISKAVTFTYTTKFEVDSSQKETYKNTGKFTGWIDGIEKNPAQIEKFFTAKSIVQNNGEKIGTYDAVQKKFFWTVKMNHNNQQWTNVMFKDTLPAGHALVEDSVKVDGEQYEVPDEDIDPLTIEFDEVKQAKIITYETIDEDGFLVRDNRNNVTITAAGGVENIFDENVVINSINKPENPEDKPDNSFVTKSLSSAQGRTLKWSLTLNESLSTLNNTQLIDTTDSKQKFDKESFYLTPSTIKNNNSSSIEFEFKDPIKIQEGTHEIQGKPYTLTFNEDSQGIPTGFSLKLGTIDTAYKLEYKAKFTGEINTTTSNKAELTYEGKTSIPLNDTASGEHIVAMSTGGGSSNTTGDLTISKVDENNQPLKDVEFTLYNFDGSQVVHKNGQPIKGVTNENGQLTFENITLDEYVLKETKALAGYKPVEDLEVVFDHNQTVTVKNIKIQSCIQPITLDNQTGIPVNTLEIYKKDSEGNFKALKDNNDTQVVATIVNGNVTLPNLDLGEYKLDLTAEDKEKLSLITQNLTFTVDEQGSGNCIIEELKLKVEECPSFDITVIGKDNAALPESFVTNSEFKLTDETGETIEVTEDGTTVLLSELTVTKDGKIQKDGQDIKDFLTPGNYTLVQTKTAIGYKPIVESIVDIEGGCKGNVTIEVIPTLGEDAACTTFHILAVGSNGVAITDPSNETYKEYVKNSTFKITTADGTLKFDKVTIDLTTGKLLSNGKEIGKDDIAIGETLKLTQSKTPIGFKSIGTVEITGSDDCFAIVPVVSSELDPGACTTFEISAKDQKGNPIEATSEYAKKSVFKLVSEGTDILTDVTIGVDGKLLKADKTVISKADLTKGAYTLVQTKTPAGYVPVTAEIVTDGNKDCGAVVTINFNKTTDSTPGISCPDFTVSYQGPANSTAAFTLTGEGYSKEITVATDATGKAVYTFDEALEPGKYTLKQTSTPSGYRTAGDVTITVADDKCAAGITVTNTKVPVPPIVPPINPDKCENPTISVTPSTGEKPKAGTTVIVTVDGKTTVGKVDENGKVTFEGTPPTLEPGKKVTVKVDGYKETTTTISEKDCTTIIIITPNDKCENPTISVITPTGDKPEKGTKVTVTVDGKTTTGTVDENGKVTFEGTPPTLEPGKKVTVKVDGYKETTSEMNEKDCDTTIVITPNDKCENPTISVTPSTGDKPEKGTKVTVTTEDGKTTTGTVNEDGTITFEPGKEPTLEPGKKVTVEVEGYEPTTTTVNDKECNTTVTITPKNACDKFEVTVEDSDGDTINTVRVTIDGKTVKTANGTYTFEQAVAPGTTVTFEKNGYTTQTVIVGDDCQVTVTLVKKDDSEEPGTDPEDPDNGGDGEDPNDGNTPDEEYPDGEYPDEEYPDADGDDNDNNDGNTGNNGNNGNDGNTGNNGNTGNDGNTGNNGNAGNNNNNAGNGNNNAPGNGNNNAANGSTGNHANTTGSSLLPQTGEQVALYSLVGMLLIGAAFMLFRRNRRKA